MLWRFSATNTHLYPGARLRTLDTPNDAYLTVGDELLLEFSDGVQVIGYLLTAEHDAAVLQMPAYRTQHATDVAARTWSIVPVGKPGRARVQKRLPAA